MRFDRVPFEAICGARALDSDEIVHGPQPFVEPFMGLLIAAGYEEHIERGGAPEPVQEDLREAAWLATERGVTYRPAHDRVCRLSLAWGGAPNCSGMAVLLAGLFRSPLHKPGLRNPIRTVIMVAALLR